MFSNDSKASCQWMSDEGAKIFLYGKPKLALLHNRNSSMDRIGNLDIPFRDINDKEDLKNNKRTLKIYAYKGDKVQIQPSNAPLKPRTYANMIADYSEIIDKKKSAAKLKESPRGLFSKLPFDSVVASWTKANKNKLIFSNSLSYVGKPQGKEHVLTERNIKDANKKSSPTIKKDTQKRDYFTDNRKSAKMRASKDSKELINRSIEMNGKQLTSGKSGKFAEVPNKFQNDFDIICGYTTTNDRKNTIADKRITAKNTDSSTNSIDIIINNLSSKSKVLNSNIKKFNIITSNSNIEVEIPLNTKMQNNNNLQSAVSGLSSKISKKSKQKQAINNTTLNTNTKEIKTRNFTQPKRSFHQSYNLSINNKAQVWQAETGFTSNRSDAAPKTSIVPIDAHTSNHFVQVLSSEKKLQSNKVEMLKSSLNATTLQQHLPLSSEQKLRKKTKLTSIGKITRHIGEKIEERKRTSAEPSIGKTSVSLKKLQDSSVTKLSGCEKKLLDLPGASIVESKAKEKNSKDVDTKEIVIRSLNENKKYKKNKGNQEMLEALLQDKKNTKISKIRDSLYPEKHRSNILISNADVTNWKPSISILQKWIQASSKKSDKPGKDGTKPADTLKKRQKENVIDYKYRVKKIPDPLKPIEKLDDGTLIDYGWKVPTRKPKPKRPGGNVPPTVKEVAPKKTTSAPLQQQLKTSQESSSIPLKVSAKSLEKSCSRRLPQCRSEAPLIKTSRLSVITKYSLGQSKQTAGIKEVTAKNLPSASDENRRELENGTAPGKSDNEGRSLGKNNTAVGGNNAASITGSLASRGDSVFEHLRSERALGKINNGPSCAQSLAETAESNGWPKFSRTESKSSQESEWPMKELVYSAWLHRFHTRKYKTGNKVD